MNRYQFNHQTGSGPQSGGRRSRSEVRDRTGHIVALRKSTPEMRTVLLHLSAVGNPCQMDRSVGLLKRIDGVSNARLFFNRTALRIYYHPDQTNVLEIVEAMQGGNPDIGEYNQIENESPKASVAL